jgi:hypothetical protein
MATKIVDNGPFDPRITSIPTVVYSGDYNSDLTRGWIIQEKPVNGIRYRCNFLYNPSVVSVSHSVNPNVVADENAHNPYDVSDFLLPLQQTLQFNLLFDRTYEMWDPSKLSGDAKDNVPFYGVDWDVQALRNITGISSPLTVTGSGSDKTGDSSESFTKGHFQSGPVGPMLYVPVYAVLGYRMDYYGVIQTLDVQYTHWTSQMVPMRCQVGITMQLLPRNTATKSSPRPSPVLMPGEVQIGSDSILNPTNNGKGGR